MKKKLTLLRSHRHTKGGKTGPLHAGGLPQFHRGEVAVLEKVTDLKKSSSCGRGAFLFGFFILNGELQLSFQVQRRFLIFVSWWGAGGVGKRKAHQDA